MTRYAMVIDISRCLGCGACVAACIAENLNTSSDELEFKPKPSIIAGLLGLPRKEIPPAEYFVEKAAEQVEPEKAQEEVRKLWLRTEVYAIPSGTYPNVSLMFYHRICQHCTNAPCVTVCPTGASFQRKDGIVLVDPNKCILCGACIAACPYAARQVDLLTKTIDKCTFCAHRVDKGLLPACVETCPAHVRIFGDLDNPNSEVSRIVAKYHPPAGTPHGPIRGTEPFVFYMPSGNYKPSVKEIEQEHLKEAKIMKKLESESS